MNARRLLRRLVPWMVLALLAAYAVLVEPRWHARRDIAHKVPGWQGPAGLKVAVASDWHLSPHALRRVMTAERARAIVREINASQPDLVLVPGDLVASELDDPSQAMPATEVAAVLGELRARLGVFAVLGNHDWWQDAPGISAALRARGINVLENDAVPLPGTPVWIVGIGDDYTGHANVKQALAKVPRGAQVIAAMHDPASLMEMPALTGLLVAGHTHGGQVSIPFHGAIRIPTAAPREWAYGWVRHGYNAMYVTSGLGVSILPIRFNMRPEWALITIHP